MTDNDREEHPMSNTQPATKANTRRTKRRYAHEFYPHPDEYEVRPLAVEVPYLYAQAIGLSVHGTGWFEAPWRDNPWAAEATAMRTMRMIDARQKALLADALLQGLGGEEAWQWAEERYSEDGEIVGDRAAHYGIDFDRIKPYPLGPEPDHHNHYEPSPHGGGWRTVTRVEGKESECDECTEPTEPTDALASIHALHAAAEATPAPDAPAGDEAGAWVCGECGHEVAGAFADGPDEHTCSPEAGGDR